MTFRTADPYADFDREDADIAREEKMLPHCSFCGEPITADYYKHFASGGGSTSSATTASKKMMWTRTSQHKRWEGFCNGYQT
mgnify:CR=1 FL=1